MRKCLLFLMILLPQLVLDSSMASLCIEQAAQNLSKPIEKPNPAHTAYAKNLIKTNRNQFFEILQKRINVEKPFDPNRQQLVNVALNTYFLTCKGSAIDCLKNAADSLSDSPSILTKLIAFIDSRTNTCKALSLVARRILLKQVTLNERNSSQIEDFFKAGFYRKISKLKLKEVIEDPVSLRFYTLSLAQLGKLEAIDEIIQSAKFSTIEKSLEIELLFRRAVALRKNGEFVESVRQVNSILSKKASIKSADWLYLEMATSYLKLNRPDLAEISLQSSITINSSNDFLKAYQAIVASNTSLKIPLSIEEIQKFDFFDIFSFCSEFFAETSNNKKYELLKLCKLITNI